MEAYLQGPNGEEVELPFAEPDPADGSIIIQAGEVQRLLAWYDERNGREANDAAETFWIRIVPNEA
jgi:hypothetical protein